MTTTREAVGFLGLGALGTPIAVNLLASGVPLHVWNRTRSKAEELAKQQPGATVAASPADAVTKGGVVFSILWDDASLEQLVADQKFLDALGPGGVHVSMTTVTPAAARRVAAIHQKHGSLYVEAPIFGVPPQAVARQLNVCLAGPTAAKERVRPLLVAMGAARISEFGENIGAATATKLMGNYLIISGFVAMQEAWNVLSAGGFDAKASLEMLTQTLITNPGQQRFATLLMSGHPLPKTGIPEKDVGLFRQLADASHTPSPFAERMLSLLEASPLARK
ncbi:MAG: NAD(P)-dependent oxidoreductase [Archangium sp.]